MISVTNNLTFYHASENSNRRRNLKVITREGLKDNQENVIAKSDPLGMQVQDITPELAQSLELESDQGVLVSDVTAGNFADESGIRRGDVISEMNRAPISNVQDYQRLLKSVNKGSSILFLVKRRGTTIYIAVKVG